jgi:hypothetical protein
LLLRQLRLRFSFQQNFILSIRIFQHTINRGMVVRNSGQMGLTGTMH